MNILIINHYAGSKFHGMEFRHFYLSKELIKKGHDVMIVAADYSHVRTNNPNIKDTSYKIESIDGINYLWIKTPKYKSNSILRILNIIVFNIKLLILRAIFGGVTMILLFWSYSLIPISLAMAISFSTPLFIYLGGIIFFKETTLL